MSFTKYKSRVAKVLRTILSLAYGFVAWAGFSALAFPQQTTAGVLPQWLTIGWASIALIGGSAAFVSVVSNNWRWEFIAAPLATAGILCYAITVWSLVIETTSRMTQGSVVLATGLLLLYRSLELLDTADYHRNYPA